MAETYSPTDLASVREQFRKLAEMVDFAMSQPALAATPDVAVVLDLLSQGLFTLARVTLDALQNDGLGGTDGEG